MLDGMHTTDDLLVRYDKPVPRYTSFPTAVQFSERIGAADYLRALGNLSAAEPVSLYLHIPFCHQLCTYCGCHTKVVNSYAPVAHYVETLLRDIKQCAAHLPGKIPAGQVHFGGGSPNILSPQDLARILQAFEESFAFPPLPRIDMECDPRLLTPEAVRAMADCGVTRVSLGIQDFNPDVQQAVNRAQSYEFVAEQTGYLRAAGITRINFDLMIGLPHQTPDTLAQTLEQALSLQPSRLAVFPYAHVPWMKKHQKLLERYDLPDSRARFAMTAQVKDTLTQAGYTAIGIDHFAHPDDDLARAQKEGRLRRNFQGYTDDPAATLLGFGISAISQFDALYVQNTTDAPNYRAHIEAGEPPVRRGCALSPEDIRRRALIERLLCDFAVDLAEFPEIPVPKAALAPLIADGLAQLDETRLTITETGLPFTRVIAACFDPYLDPEAGRHAKAV